LDEIGWGKFIAAIRRLINEVSDFEVESVQRVAEGGGECTPTTFAVAGFESPKQPKPKRSKHKNPKRKSSKSTKAQKGKKGKK